MDNVIYLSIESFFAFHFWADLFHFKSCQMKDFCFIWFIFNLISDKFAILRKLEYFPSSRVYTSFIHGYQHPHWFQMLFCDVDADYFLCSFKYEFNHDVLILVFDVFSSFYIVLAIIFSNYLIFMLLKYAWQVFWFCFDAFYTITMKYIENIFSTGSFEEYWIKKYYCIMKSNYLLRMNDWWMEWSWDVYKIKFMKWRLIFFIFCS